MIAPGTPLPWVARIGHGRWFVAGHSGFVATMDTPVRDLQEANAAYISHACNLYPELVEALQNLLAVNEGEGGTRYHAQDIARAALAKAGAA